VESGLFADSSVPVGGFSFFDFATSSWRDLSADGFPWVALQSGEVLWTGHLLVGWGGQIGQGAHYQVLTNQGAFYDPRTDRWKAMSTSGAPIARALAGNIVTGDDRIFVWGGAVRSVVQTTVPPDDPEAKALTMTPGLTCPSQDPLECSFGDGAIYDPASDRWTGIASAGAPSPRMGHIMAWTGTHLLVWGGNVYLPGPSYALWTTLADGALYDPSTGTWTPTAPYPAPVTANLGPYWRDGRLVVSTFFYDPARNEWRPVAPLPSGKFDYQTFDPINNRWLSFPARAGAPEQPVQVFTGQYLFEWGGWRAGPTPPNPCPTNPPQIGCDPPGPQPVPTNEGAVALPLLLP
jgi:hypothetical protein